jgi:hypothetical protein
MEPALAELCRDEGGDARPRSTRYGLSDHWHYRGPSRDHGVTTTWRFENFQPVGG